MQSTLFFLLRVPSASSLFSFSNKKNFFPAHKELLPLWQFAIPIKKECISLKQYIFYLDLKAIYNEKKAMLLQQEYYSPG
jgi:hypothetical protein